MFPFIDDEVLDIPLEESLMEELRKQERRKRGDSVSDVGKDSEGGDHELSSEEIGEELKLTSQRAGIGRHLQNDDQVTYPFLLSPLSITNASAYTQYYCKHCDRAWPKTSFKNAQQFGAHCSNCARQSFKVAFVTTGYHALIAPLSPFAASCVADFAAGSSLA